MLIISTISEKKCYLQSFTITPKEETFVLLKKFKYTHTMKAFRFFLLAILVMAIPAPKGAAHFLFTDGAKAHSWVIDGGKYSSGAYLLHFNFGWGGDCNGYFSPSCLNPSQGIEYDNGYIYDEDDDYTYSWHFRVITYDIPSSPSTLQVEF